MWTDEEFHTYSERMHFAEPARRLLQAIRKSPPSRRVRSGRGNTPVWFTSVKMGCTIQCESHTVAFPYAFSCELDDRVYEMFDEVEPLTLRYEDVTGRQRGVSHTPDYAVLREDGAGWVECKGSADLVELHKRMPNRYVLDGKTWRCPPGEAYAREFGLFYEIHTPEEIPPILFRNLLFLADYLLTPLDASGSGNALQLIQEFLAEEPGMLLLDLLEQRPVKADDVYRLIASRQVYVDLNKAPLATPGHVRVFVNQVTAEAYVAVQTDEPFMPRAVQITLRPGEQLKWDGCVWTIANIGESSLTLMRQVGDDSHLQRLSDQDFKRLLSEGALVPVGLPCPQGLSPAAQRILSSATEDEKKEALRRQAILQAAARLMALESSEVVVIDSDQTKKDRLLVSTISPRTLRKYQQLARLGEASYRNPFIELLPRTSKQGNRKRKMSDRQYEDVHAFIQSEWLTPKQKTKTTAHRAYELHCTEQGINAVSYKTFCREIDTYGKEEELQARTGRRGAYRAKAPRPTSDVGIPRHGDYPWQKGHIDHTEVDLHLSYRGKRRPLGRAWWTILVLSSVRRIVSSVLMFAKPSYISCMMAVRVCVQRFQRLPTFLVVDGGAEFQSVCFETLLAAYEVSKQLRPAAEPRFGAPIERVLKTTNQQFIHTLVANTQIMKDPRRVTKSVNPEKLAVWSLGDLYVVLCTYAYETYDQQEHSALGMSPREAYEEGLCLAGARIHKLIPYDHFFKIMSLPLGRRKTALVRPGKGIRVGHLDYWTDAFRDPKVEGHHVEYKPDFFDLSRAYVYVQGQWIEACSNLSHEFRGRTLKERDIAAEEWRQLHRTQPSHLDLARTLRDIDRKEKYLQELLQIEEDKCVMEVMNSDPLAIPRNALAALHFAASASPPDRAFHRLPETSESVSLSQDDGKRNPPPSGPPPIDFNSSLEFDLL